MHRYHVKFYYKAELRCDWEGYAYSEFRALAAALDFHKLEHWSISPEFHIEISRKY